MTDIVIISKIVEPKGMTFLIRRTLDQQVKQLKEIERIVGRPTVKKQIDAAPLGQENKDYIYAKMGWL
jgi:hypothetical protein